MAIGRFEFIGLWTVELKKNFLEEIKRKLLTDGSCCGILEESLEEINLEELSFDWEALVKDSFSRTINDVFPFESKDLAKAMSEQKLSISLKYVERDLETIYEVFGTIFPKINKEDNLHCLSYIEEMDKYCYTAENLKRFGFA